MVGPTDAAYIRQNLFSLTKLSTDIHIKTHEVPKVPGPKTENLDVIFTFKFGLPLRSHGGKPHG